MINAHTAAAFQNESGCTVEVAHRPWCGAHSILSITYYTHISSFNPSSLMRQMADSEWN